MTGRDVAILAICVAGDVSPTGAAPVAQEILDLKLAHGECRDDNGSTKSYTRGTQEGKAFAPEDFGTFIGRCVEMAARPPGEGGITTIDISVIGHFARFHHVHGGKTTELLYTRDGVYPMPTPIFDRTLTISHQTLHDLHKITTFSNGTPRDMTWIVGHPNYASRRGPVQDPFLQTGQDLDVDVAEKTKHAFSYDLEI